MELSTSITICSQNSECTGQSGQPEAQVPVNEMRNTLQSIVNCAYLVACDDELSKDNRSLMTQIQCDIATLALLVRHFNPMETLTLKRRSEARRNS